tara:strand:+ start:809 stop:2788 length:1980 start_codon:yes stop_codon:yes gene_type:complete
MEKTLFENFNLKCFRAGQKEIIQSIIEGKNVFTVMPTGSGKSLCYQYSAIVKDELTVVISPLIALMNSQVNYLKKLKISCGALTSNTSIAEQKEIADKLQKKTLKLLYIAPERLTKISTLKLLRKSNTKLIVVDEAHCISQWGHDFRPSYLLIGDLRKSLKAQLVAFTATADKKTKEDIIIYLFNNTKPKTFFFGYDRPNIFLSFGLKESPRNQILRFIEKNKNENGIIYCSTRAKTESLAQAINNNRQRALAYHAGLNSNVRQDVENAFRSENNLIIVATIAFGMGLDKENIRWVAHADLPQSIESYYQEIGRAGRDNKPAKTLTLYSYDDIKYRQDQIEEGAGSLEQKKLKHKKLNQMIGLADGVSCRRQTLLKYFGDDTEPCGNCDLCINPRNTFEATKDVLTILELINHSKEKYLLSQIINTLLASEKIFSEYQWLSIIRQMMGKDLIRLSPIITDGFIITNQGKAFLNSKEKLYFNSDLFFEKFIKKNVHKLVNEEENALFLRLKAHRRTLSEQNQIPSYFIFNDSTLIEMVKVKPKDLDTLIKIRGVGPKKLKKFGISFLKIINFGILAPVHPVRRRLVGKPSASIFDKLMEVQNKLAHGKDGYSKKVTCSPAVIARISKLINPTQENVNIVLGNRRASRFGKAFFKILKDQQ